MGATKQMQYLPVMVSYFLFYFSVPHSHHPKEKHIKAGIQLFFSFSHLKSFSQRLIPSRHFT